MLQQSGGRRELRMAIGRWFARETGQMPVSPRPELQLQRAGLLHVPFLLLPPSVHSEKQYALIRAAWRMLLEACPELRLAVPITGNRHFGAVASSCAQCVALTGNLDESLLAGLYQMAQ